MNRYSALFLVAAIAALPTACQRADDRADDAATDTAPPVGAEGKPAQTPPTVQAAFVAIDPVDSAQAAKVRCALDKFNGQRASAQTFTVNANSELRFQGWVSGPAKNAPGEFTIVLSGPATYGAAGTAGIKRADVARAMKAEGLMNSGFDIRAALGPVAPGEYEVAITQGAGGGLLRCATTARIVVTGPQG